MSDREGDRSSSSSGEGPYHGERISEYKAEEPDRQGESEELADECDSEDGRTKRERRRAQVQDVGANDKARGEAYKDADGSVDYWQPSSPDGEEGRWIDAVYHNDIRGELLAQASNNGQDTYDHLRERGSSTHDETAFLESQRQWRGDEKQRLSTITDDVMNRFERKGYPRLTDHVGPMYFEGKIVLDQDSHPVKDYNDIPATLSSQVEGWLLEAISRVDSRIQKIDFRARMPWNFINKHNKSQDLYGLSAISNRIMREGREPYGLIPWIGKAGSTPWKNYVTSQMTDQDLASNTTANLRAFTKEEINAAKRPNKGHFLEKAGNSRLADKARRAAEKKKSGTQLTSNSISKSKKTRRMKVSRTKPARNYMEDSFSNGADKNYKFTPCSADTDRTASHAEHSAGDDDYIAMMQASNARNTQSPASSWPAEPADATAHGSSNGFHAALTRARDEQNEHRDIQRERIRLSQFKQNQPTMSGLAPGRACPDTSRTPPRAVKLTPQQIEALSTSGTSSAVDLALKILTTTSEDGLIDQTAKPAREEVIDYRFIPPANGVEEAHIQAALGISHQLLGRYFNETVFTTHTLCYSEQWDELQKIYNDNMPDVATRVAHNIQFMPLYLPRLSTWHDGFAAWSTFNIINAISKTDGEYVAFGEAGR